MREEELSESLSEGPRSGGFDGVNPLATDVLRRNGLKSWTKPAPSLYPHQWSWDSAFIALGLAHVDNRRATDELDSLFRGQWSTGKVPHIVFDPDASGLVTIYHPWESGTDNSPRWDAVLERISVGESPSYTRYDLQHVSDPSHRPTDSEYDRFLWLLELLKRARYDEADIYERHPFLIKDVLFSAILVAANEALLEISEVVEAPREDRALIEGWIERGRAGLEEQWDPNLGLCLDQDVIAGEPLRVRTVAGFAPLIAGGLDRSRLRDLLRTLDSQAFAGNPKLRHPLPPSTSPEEPGFHPRSYWRGPVWPVANWLLWWSLLRAGESEKAQKIRRETLEELSEGGFAEYFEPFTGEALGSGEQSWTAAVALDMLATGGAD